MVHCDILRRKTPYVIRRSFASERQAVQSVTKELSTFDKVFLLLDEYKRTQQRSSEALGTALLNLNIELPTGTKQDDDAKGRVCVILLHHCS